MTNKIRKEKLNALKEDFKAAVRFDAKYNYKFDKEVNDILKRDGYKEQSFITPKKAIRMADAFCNTIINSDMSMDDKEFMMKALDFLYKGAAFAERRRVQDFEDRVEDIDLVVDQYKMEENNKSVE